MLAGLGAMGTPQVQQRLEGRDAKVNETHINDGLFQTLLLMIYIYIIGFSLFTKDSMYSTIQWEILQSRSQLMLSHFSHIFLIT